MKIEIIPDIKVETQNKIKFLDCRPLVEEKDTLPYLPESLKALKMINSDVVDGLKADDILMIDTSLRIFTEGLISVFEYKGCIFVRRFAIAPFGYKEIKNKKVLVSVDGQKDYYPYDDINLIGIVVAKQNRFL